MINKPHTNYCTSREQDSAVPPSELQLTWSGKEQNRRELLTAVLRYATLGTLGVIGGAVFVKSRRLAQNGICINNGICKGCGIFEQCGLPPALSEKQLLTRMDDERK